MKCKPSKIAFTHHAEFSPVDGRIILVRNVTKYMLKKYGRKKSEKINLKKALSRQ